MLRWYIGPGAWRCALIAGGLSGAVPTRAADPVLSLLQPYGLQRGTEVTVRLQRRTARAMPNRCCCTGRGSRSRRSSRPMTRRWTSSCRWRPIARSGLHAVRVRTATGISNLQLFSVGALPEVAEQEPNSEFAGAAVGAPRLHDQRRGAERGRGLLRRPGAEGSAHWRWNWRECGWEFRPGDGTFFDPYVAILNAQRFELARCDDAALLQQDCVCAPSSRPRTART